MIKTINDLKEWATDYNNIAPIFKKICARRYEQREEDFTLFSFYFEGSLCVAEWSVFDYRDEDERYYEYKFPYDWILKPWIEVALLIDENIEKEKQEKHELEKAELERKKKLKEDEEKKEYERLKAKYGEK